MPRSIQLSIPRPSYESMVEQLRLPKSRRAELLAIMKDQKDDLAISSGAVLFVSGMQGVGTAAAVVGAQLGMEVEVVEGHRAALAALRRREYLAVVIDESLAECDPSAAEKICEHTGLAIPMQINFAASGTARLVREIRAALNRREREQTLARRAAVAAIETELKTTVAGLLLHSQLALSGDKVPTAVAERLRMVADFGESIRANLAKPEKLAS